MISFRIHGMSGHSFRCGVIIPLIQVTYLAKLHTLAYALMTAIVPQISIVLKGIIIKIGVTNHIIFLKS